MEENTYQLFQHKLEVHEVMRVHYEEKVFPSIYPCSEFMNAAGILQDFQTLISNAGLEHFIDDEPPQYVKITMSVVQDLDSVGPHLTPWFIIKSIINLWTCPLMFSVQPLEYHSGDHAKR
jgi:hypothetical protein